MADDTRPSRPTPADFARWISDLHCLWRFCGKRACTRGRACRGAPKDCLPLLPLVPPEAREFIRHWDDAQREGLTFDEMMDEYAEQWDTLMQWQDLVARTLPENRKAKAA